MQQAAHHFARRDSDARKELMKEVTMQQAAHHFARVIIDSAKIENVEVTMQQAAHHFASGSTGTITTQDTSHNAASSTSLCKSRAYKHALEAAS